VGQRRASKAAAVINSNVVGKAVGREKQVGFDLQRLVFKNKFGLRTKKRINKMKKLETNSKILGGLAILSCSILIPSIISITIFDKMIIDLNKGGILIFMTIVCIVQHYRLRIKILESKNETSN
jgi:hypothetical protein